MAASKVTGKNQVATAARAKAKKSSSAPQLATPRATANLTLSFGMFLVPISLGSMFQSSRTNGVSGRICCPEHKVPLSQRYVCPEGEEVYEKGETLTLYETAPKSSEFVEVPDEEIEALIDERTGDVPITKFVDAEAIDPIWLADSKAYLVWANQETGKGALQAFGVLAGGMQKFGKAIVCEGVLRKHNQQLVLRWSDELGCVVAHVCQFHSAIRWADVEKLQHISETLSPSKDELDLAEKLFAMGDGEFDSADVDDTYTPLLRELIDLAAAGKLKQRARPKKTDTAEPETDVMAQLQATLNAVVPKKPRKKAA